MNWYNTLDINRKITLKEMSILIIGISFADLSFLFNYKERIEIIHDKLIFEGII